MDVLTMPIHRRTMAVGAMLALALSMACSRQASTTARQDVAHRAHVFRGTVEQVDVTAKTLTVNGEAVEGWMPAMTMVYLVDTPGVFTKVTAGDRITANVYDGDFKTLHDVDVAAPTHTR
jgi:Cu/Ag efflux protein CusF